MNGLLFTYALTYGGGAVSLYRPFHGLLIYVCFAILKPPALWPWAVPPGNYSRIIGVAFLAGWAMNGFGDSRLGRAKPVVLALLGYFLWVILSTAFGMDPARGLPFVEYLAKIILPFVAGVTLIHTWAQLKQLLWVIVGSCAFLAYETNLLYLNGFNLEANGFFGLDNNSFSILMVASFGLVLVLALEDQVMWRRLCMLGVAAAMAHVPMMSLSRGGMLGILVSSVVAVAIIPKSKSVWLAIAAAVVVGAILAGPSVIDEFSTSFQEGEQRDASAQSRILLWMDCTDATLRNPFFGLGQECWQLVTVSYGWPKSKDAHSLWFQTAAELGIPGVTFLILFYFQSVWTPYKAARQTDFPWMPMLARMMAVSLAGFVVSAAFVTVEGFELPYYISLLGACGVKIAWDEHALELSESENSWVEHDEHLVVQHVAPSAWAGAQ